jgi:4-amino-4-deoxy-L-arabinose transferase-like glycosyltransferase
MHFKKFRLSDESLKKYSSLILVFFFLIIFLQASVSSFLKSPTWDEISFIGYGRHVIERKSFNFNPSVYEPMLSYYLNSFFLMFLKVDDKIWYSDNFYENVSINLIYHSGYSPSFVLYLSRLPTIILSLLLAFYLFRWSRELYGIKAAFISLILYSFSPMLLANIRVAHTELPMACFSFISLYYFWKFLDSQKIKHLVLTSIMVSLALLSKFIAITLIPIFILFILFSKKINLTKKAYCLGLIFLILFLLIWVAYGFQFQTLRESFAQHYVERIYEESAKIESAQLRNFMVYTFENVPLPFPSFIGYLGNLAYISNRGMTGYFLGEIFDSSQKPLYYFLIAFLIKTPISLIILIFFSIIYFRQIRYKKLSLEFLITIPILLIFVLLSFNKLSYPLRHMLVIYPLLFLFVSKSVNIKIKKQNYFKLFYLVLLLWYIASSLSVFPHHGAYYNELIGGPKNGYKYLLAENTDTGEDLIFLKNYLDKNNIKKINFSYHGTVDPAEYGIDYDYMPSACFQYWVPGYQEFGVNCLQEYTEDCSKRKGIVAISVSNLQNRFLKNTSCFNWLKQYEPIQTIGYSIHVYNLTDPG